jgi:uncharacterized membrane protein
VIESSINAFYQFLNNYGFPDPLHAALVHMPIGLVVGAFVLGWIATFLDREKLAMSAHHCIILAFLFWFPAVLFGLMDWQYFYRGAWLTPIKMKLILASILLILFAAALFFGYREKAGSKKATLTIYTLCLITVVLLGWFGARLVYAEKNKDVSKTYQRGEKIFVANCKTCHPGGGNVIQPAKPFKNSPALKNLDAFISLIRHPNMPMPASSPSQVSDSEAKELYKYITNELTNSGQQSMTP